MLDLDVLAFHHFVLQVGPSLHQARRGDVVVSLFSFELFNPGVPIHFFLLKTFLQALNCSVEVFLRIFQVPLDALTLDLESLTVAFELEDFAIKVFNFLGALDQGVLLGPEHLLQATCLLDFFTKLDLVLVPDLVGDV